jgi:hypothetical protein
MSDDPFDPAEIADRHRAADVAALEAAQRRREARWLRDEALRALDPLQAHTKEDALNEALADPPAAPQYSEKWVSLDMRFGRALADAHLADRLSELAPESGGGKIAVEIMKAACSGGEGGVRELFKTAWVSPSLVHSVNYYLRDFIPDRLLNPRPLGALAGSEPAAPATQRQTDAEDPAVPFTSPLSAPDLARLLRGRGLDRATDDAVGAFLRKYREKHPDSYIDIDRDDRRHNTARYLYRPEVWPWLFQSFRRRAP